MKSVTIKDKYGMEILKVIHRKSGEYELIMHTLYKDLIVDVRDDNNKKVWLMGNKEALN